MAIVADAKETKEPKDAANEAGDDALDPKIGNMVNAAVSSHLKRHFKGLGDQIGSMLDERLSSLNLKPQKDEAPAPAPAKGQAASEDEDTKAELAKLRKEMKEHNQRAAEKEAYADVRSQLAGKIRPEAMETAIKVLRADGAIKVNRDGSVSFKHADGDMELSEGLSEWLKGEGAMFAPAPMAKKPQVRGPNRAPVRTTAGGGDENLTPAQKSARALAARGLKLMD